MLSKQTATTFISTKYLHHLSFLQNFLFVLFPSNWFAIWQFHLTVFLNLTRQVSKWNDFSKVQNTKSQLQGVPLMLLLSFIFKFKWPPGKEWGEGWMCQCVSLTSSPTAWKLRTICFTVLVAPLRALFPKSKFCSRVWCFKHSQCVIASVKYKSEQKLSLHCIPGKFILQ